jgi:putative FmdB family regulatory protein
MPIYAYKCESCGHSKDVLQKMSDAPLTDCPQCGAATFKKQLTAAGFQLKGSGWYVTDFRDGKGGADKAKESGGSDKADVPASAAAGATPTPAKSETSNAAAAPAPAPAASPPPAPKATP